MAVTDQLSGVGITLLPAANISITDAGDYYTSTNAEGALQEVGADITAINTTIDNLLETGLVLQADNIAALRLISPSSAPIFVSGYYTPRDGGHGFYRGVTGAAAGTYVDNGGSIIVPTGGNGSTAWLLQHDGRINVRQFGAKGDNVANDAAALTACNAVANQVIVPPGNFKVTANVTFTKPVSVINGGMFYIGTGLTVAFNGGYEAGLYKTFTCTGSGKVTFDWTHLKTGYPEWWGASADMSTDSLVPINSCIIACRETRLQPGDYYVSSTVKLSNPYRDLVGAGCQYNGVSSQVTRLLVDSPSLNCIQIGPDSNPGAINSFQMENAVRDIHVARMIAPSISGGSTGILIQFTLYTYLENVKCNEHIYGFQFAGAVSARAVRCYATRTSAGTGAGTDKYYGYYVQGYTNIGAAGGNASIYIDNCSAGCSVAGLISGQSYGLYADNNFTDCFIESFETVQCAIGIAVIGNTSGVGTSNTDFQIKNPIIDAYTTYGIYIKNVNYGGSVEINGGYTGAASAGLYAIFVSDSNGTVNINGGQHILYPATAPNAGIGVLNSRGVVVNRAIIMDCRTEGVVLNGGFNCDIRPIIQNNGAYMTGSAVKLYSSSRNFVGPLVHGTATGIVAAGVNLISTANSYNEVDCTGIDPACLTSGSSTNKLYINSVAITSAGASGTNLASGIMS